MSGPSGSIRSASTAGPCFSQSPTIVVLGMTGDGKSNLGTWLLGDCHAFAVSDSAESCTDIPQVIQGPCFGGKANYSGTWKIVDTPGLSDSAGRDAENLRSTVKLLKEQVKQVNAFVLVVNAQQDRMSAALKNTIRVFRGCFGPTLWSNLCVVFSKWDWKKEFGGFTVDKLRERSAAWRKWFAACEMEYNGSGDVSGAEIQFFGVDLPSLALVLNHAGPDAVQRILTEASKDNLSSTADQLQALYNHLYVVMAAKNPVSMHNALAETKDLHEEVVRRLNEEKEERAKKEKELENRLKEEQLKREQEQKRFKERQEQLAKEAKFKEDQIKREAKQREEQLAKEAKEREDRLKEEQKAAEKKAEEAQAKADMAKLEAYMSSMSARNRLFSNMQPFFGGGQSCYSGGRSNYSVCSSRNYDSDDDGVSSYRSSYSSRQNNSYNDNSYHKPQAPRQSSRSDYSPSHASSVGSIRSSPSCSSASSPKLSWNDFQKTLAGQGLNSTQRAARYREYKK